MKKIEDLTAYEVIEKRQIDDIGAMSWLLRHKKTGARIALLSNDDENKVFYIGFRTPPTDSTGVPHIVEHTVLCGSKDFPVKDPFVELVKGSLNTFLNAMTYSDKTVYPIASCNDKDFQNLMHVYLDAVFYPNIYHEKKIFQQEGWHYEMEDADSPLTLNGVVYNEMKGAFSSPDEVHDREVVNSLYPNTPYGVESGGDPKVIPSLSYEQFLDFHRRYYHPSNSYLYLYGNMDMAEKLEWIDENYLGRFDKLEIDSALRVQAPFEKPVEIYKEYPIMEGESLEDNTYLSYNTVVGTSLDKELYYAMEILEYALCSASAAPLKQALIHKNIGTEVYSVYNNGIYQPYFSIVAKNANVSQKEEFVRIIEQELARIVKEGIDKKSLLAGLNYYEFRYREADFGSYPKGLMYGLQMLDSWLYDDHMPFDMIEAIDIFKQLKAKINTDYYEKLIEKYLINNQHKSILVVAPKEGLTAKEENELADRLAAYKAGLSDNEIAQIVADTKALHAYQEEEDSPEKLAMIPM
ncbi:MAG: insulinase family protein, partial [Lachnospiraceae bacterium]|nr:insulinase family protein [Lachnospiraceae bacterium]